MHRRAFLGGLAPALLAAPFLAQAQPGGKVYRIGVVALRHQPRTIGLAIPQSLPLRAGRVIE